MGGGPSNQRNHGRIAWKETFINLAVFNIEGKVGSVGNVYSMFSDSF